MLNFRGEGGGDKCQKNVSKYNVVPNYLMMMKLRMGWLDLNNKKSFLAILGFSILRAGNGENAGFREIWIFEHNSALNCSTMKKFYVRRLDLNTKKPLLMIF